MLSVWPNCKILEMVRAGLEEESGIDFGGKGRKWGVKKEKEETEIFPSGAFPFHSWVRVNMGNHKFPAFLG